MGDRHSDKSPLRRRQIAVDQRLFARAAAIAAPNANDLAPGSSVSGPTISPRRKPPLQVGRDSRPCLRSAARCGRRAAQGPWALELMVSVIIPVPRSLSSSGEGALRHSRRRRSYSTSADRFSIGAPIAWRFAVGRGELVPSWLAAPRAHGCRSGKSRKSARLQRPDGHDRWSRTLGVAVVSHRAAGKQRDDDGEDQPGMVSNRRR